MVNHCALLMEDSDACVAPPYLIAGALTIREPAYRQSADRIRSTQAARDHLPQYPRRIPGHPLEPGYDHGYTQGMKTAISIPDPIFQEADQTARRLGLSRSELFARAMTTYLEKHRGLGVTEALDRIYGEEDSSLDPVLAQMQSASLPREKW